MDIVSILASFLMIFLAELGDKTQLTVITLSSQYPALQVFAGALFGILVVDGLSIALGGSLISIMPVYWITLVFGLIFISFGILTLKSKNDSVVEIKCKARLPIITRILIYSAFLRLLLG